MKPDPLPADIEKKLMSRLTHFCAVCLTPIRHGLVCERAGIGTNVVAICHERRIVTHVPDAMVEDSVRIWHFVDGEGVPYESPAAKRKRALQAEVDALRAARRGGT